MNDNITYVQQFDHRQPPYSQGNIIQYETQAIEFHPTSVAQYTPSSGQYHNSNTTFITSNGQELQIPQNSQIQVVQIPSSGVQSSQPQHILITTQPVGSAPTPDQDDSRRVAFAEYFVEQPATIISTAPYQGAIQGQLVTTPGNRYQKSSSKPVVIESPDKIEKEAAKRKKQAEAARLRYHRLSAEDKKALNLKRTLAQKRKRQRERELAELESILRASNDIVDDPEVIEQLREKRMRARWAEAARSRYQRMTSEERKAHNQKRRMRQITLKNEKGELIKDEDAIREKVKERNAKKAEAARLRYHRMNPDEKKLYNQRRTEAFRKRRMEEEQLLAMPIGRINGEALDRAQQIVVRNAKRAEAARLRYQRMTPEQRKAYNQKRYTPKRKRQMDTSGQLMGHIDEGSPQQKKEEEYDALSSLERDVLKRTQQAQQVLLRQRQGQYPPGTTILQTLPPGATVTQVPVTMSGNGQTVGAHIIQQQTQPPNGPGHQHVTYYQ
ncbi:unnamed protein product [Bursaphelenchus xylophilus]|uniref:(pine wood nematode) hypothetical protein n=1 Tax=Bursaphelenchus xylophilus TaxID=6326 RepID=A0A1I7SUC6_BURXY|nr:unnamed protein product [Bursaphelenchus xylophilus]CAG9107295.1 unnamed protein product [Bursaphelenchus xylophilus]